MTNDKSQISNKHQIANFKSAPNFEPRRGANIQKIRLPATIAGVGK